MILRSQSGQIIQTLEDWFTYAPPAKGELHWKDRRSVKELAKAWVKNGLPKMPVDVSDLLATNPKSASFQVEWASPEYETKLDDFKGSGRNHDLIIVGNVDAKKTLISIEAKVDESFGDIVTDYVSKSIKANPRPKVPDRVNQLSTAIFGEKDASSLRYQLIHAVAGTLIEAKNQNAEQAIFIVHEFVPFGKHSQKAKQNDKYLQAFAKLLIGDSLPARQLVGPLYVPGGGFVPKEIPLYIGKVETVIENHKHLDPNSAVDLSKLKYFKANVGGYFGPSYIVEVDVKKGLVSYEATEDGMYIIPGIETLPLTSDAWNKLIEGLKKCEFAFWLEEYIDQAVLDGTQWSVEVRLSSGKTIRKYGSNHYPRKWKQFCKVVSFISGIEFG